MPVRLRYIFGEAATGLRRQFLMTAATVLTVMVTLTMTGAGLLLQRQVDLARRVLYADVEVSIFLTEEITPSQQEALASDLQATDVVEEVIYETKEQAYANALQIFADDPNILQGLSPDILPTSFRVKLTDPEEFEVIRSLFDGRPGVEEVVDQRDLLRDFFQVMNLLQGFSIVVAALIAIAASMLIATTIRLTAYARREQISIMKLVGATNWYIRLPFMVEGVFASVVGAFLAFGVLLLAERFVVRPLRGTVEFLPFVGSADVIAIFPLMVVGIAVGAICISWGALWRYL